MGLKENVIIGNLIPAGTGLPSYRDIMLSALKPDSEKYDLDDSPDEDFDIVDEEDEEIDDLDVETADVAVSGDADDVDLEGEIDD